MLKKCKYCERSDCKEYDYRIVSVIFDKESNCTITRDVVKEADVVELFKRNNLPIVRVNGKETIIRYKSLSEASTASNIPGYRIDTKYGFHVLTALNLEVPVKVDNIDLQLHFDSWINNKVTNGRFRCLDEIDYDCEFEDYIVSSSSALQYANLYEKVAKYKVAFIRELFNVKNTNKGNDDNFHNGVPFDIHKPVYCSCGEQLNFNYSSTRSDDMYAKCDRCGKTYNIHSEPVYRKVIE